MRTGTRTASRRRRVKLHAESSIIESIRTFFLTCPFLHDGRVNVDYLGEEMSYSIDPLPCDPVVQKYVDGGKKKQYQFAICSKEVYDEDARVNIENSGFYQGLRSGWKSPRTMGNFRNWQTKNNIQ